MKQNCNIKILLSAFLLSVTPLIKGQDNVYQESLSVDKSTGEITSESQLEQAFGKTADVSFSGMLLGSESVYLQENGQIGNSFLIMIRGINTLNLNASPTIIVDGVPVKYTSSIPSFLSNYEPSRFHFINPNDVKSVSVLRNGNELSFLGGRGSNGALHVETDRGTLGGTQIDFSARFGVLTSNYNVDNMNASEFKYYLRGYYLENGWRDEANFNPIFSNDLLEYNNSTNWMDVIMRNTMFQDYHLKLKGGDGDANYMFSVGYTDKGESIQNMDLQRVGMRFNIDYRLSDKISISNNLSYSNISSVYAEEGYDYSINPIFIAATKAPFLNPYLFSSGGELTNLDADFDELGKSNPNALVNNLKNDNEENRIDGLISAKWDLRSSASINSSFAFNYFNIKEKQYRPSFGIVQDQNRVRQNSKRTSSESQINWNTWFEKKGVVGNDNHYNFMTGFLLESAEEKSIFFRKINAGSDDYETMDQGVVDSTKTVSHSLRLFDYFLSGKVDLFERLTVDARLNIEGSSNYGNMGRWNIYPGVWATCDLLNRSGNNQISLFAGWGKSGNADLRGYHHLNLYYTANYFGYGGLFLGNISNKSIKPEITNTYDVGLQFSLFNNRLNIESGYYIKNTSDLIVHRNLPIELGQDVQFENNGSVVSKGIELMLDANLINNKRVNWSLAGSLSTLNNEIRELEYGDVIRTECGITTISRAGESVGSFYGYKVLGVFKTKDEVDLTKQDGSSYQPGDYMFEDINRDGKININDRQVLGSPLPDLFGSFGTLLKIRQFSFSALFTYSIGNDIYNNFNQQMHSMRDYSNQSVDVLDRWISTAQPGNGKISRAAFEDPSGNNSVSDLWIEDGSYLKLKNVTLNYQVPNTGNIKFINELNLFLTADNLITFTQYSGFDPEVVSSTKPMFRGIDFGASPSPRSLVFGVKLSL